MGQPSQNGPLTFQPSLPLPPDIRKAPLVVPTSIVTPSWLIAVVLRFLDHAPSYSACIESLDRRRAGPGSRSGRFGSFALCVAKGRSPQMSALPENAKIIALSRRVIGGHLQCDLPCPLCPPQADMCIATSDVRYGPEADICSMRRGRNRPDLPASR